MSQFSRRPFFAGIIVFGPNVTDELPKATSERTPQKPPRRQHVVPQFYLGRWADDREHILMTDKTDGRRMRTSLGAAAVIKDFYTVETTDGKSYAVEDWLATLEGRAAEILRKIDEGEFPLRSKEDHDTLAVYIAFQHARGREFHDLLESAAQAITEVMAIGLSSHPDAMRVAMERTSGTKPSAAEVDEQRKSMRKALDEKRITTTVPRSYAVGDMIAIAPNMAEVIAQRSWILLSSDDARFITSDVPVGMIGGTFADGRRMPLGLMTATEISFPIDARHSILMDRPGQAEAVVRVTDEMVLTLNARQHMMARRFTFQHPEDPFVFDERARAAALEAPEEPQTKV
jgi:hypothetical protein